MINGAYRLCSINVQCTIIYRIAVPLFVGGNQNSSTSTHTHSINFNYFFLMLLLLPLACTCCSKWSRVYYNLVSNHSSDQSSWIDSAENSNNTVKCTFQLDVISKLWHAWLTVLGVCDQCCQIVMSQWLFHFWLLLPMIDRFSFSLSLSLSLLLTS